MRSLRQIVNDCSVEELRECARVCRLPHVGDKDQLISALVDGQSMDIILESMGSETLRKICRRNRLPVSGIKNLLVARIFDITDTPNATTRKKCHLCGRMGKTITMDKHHFIPKHTTGDDEGGTVYVHVRCHRIWHHSEEQEQSKKSRQLTEDESRRLTRRVSQEIRDGKWGRT